MVLRLMIDERGRVDDVRVLQSSGSRDLDALAVQELRRVSYRPAESEGAPVSDSVLQELTLRGE